MHPLIEEIPLGDRRLREFVAAPWRIHHRDPNWTPPLRADLLGSRLLGIKGLLTPAHPYHRDAEVTHFLARDGRHLIGRVSAAVNHRFNAHYQSRIGFFGFFETIDDAGVAEGLLDHARRWLEDRGMTHMRGPGGYSTATHEPHQGVLIDGFEYPPTMELTHNPPYYAALLERYGLRKVKDYHAYWLDVSEDPNAWLVGLAANVRSRRRIATRAIDLSRPREEVDLIVRIYNEAWAKNWGFLPLTDAEAEAMADSLKIVADAGLIRFAYVRDRLAAVLGALPDPNVPFKPRWNRLADTDLARVARLLATRRRIPRLRLMFFGIRPRFRGTGIDAILYQEVLAHALKRGYRGCEPSLLLEDNALVLRAAASMGGHRYKTWRIYEMPLGSDSTSQIPPSGSSIRSPSR